MLPPHLLPSPLGAGLRIAVTLAVLAILLRSVDPEAVAGLAGGLHWPVFLLAVVSMGAAYPLHAIRLGILLRQQRIELPFRELHRITWISVFFGSFTPGGVGGDVSRLVHMYGRHPDNKAGGTVAVIADRVIGLAMLLLLATGASTYCLSRGAASPELKFLVPILGLALAALVVGWLLLSRWPAAKGAGRLTAVRDAARKSLHPPVPLLAAAAVSLLIWIADFTAGWLLARALNWAVGWVEISVALAVAYAVASMPVSFGGHGVREGALVIVLGWFGLAHGATPLALAFLLLTVFWGLVGGAIWLLAPVKASPAR